MEQRNIELLLIAGDMSNDYLQSYQFIQDLKENVVYQSYSSLVIMTIGLQKHHSVQKQIYEFYASKPDCLIGKPYVVNDHWTYGNITVPHGKIK